MFRRNRATVVASLFAVVLFSAIPGLAQTVLVASATELPPASDTSASSYVISNPKIAAVSARTLAGRPITLPIPGRLTLIVGALGSDGTGLVADWWMQASELCARHAVLDCYQTADASRQSAPRELRDRVVVVAGHTEPWKTALDSNAGANAYAVLLAPDGTPLWQAAGSTGEPMPTANLDELLLARKY